MKDEVLERFVKRWEEVTELPTQQLGPLTPLYKMLTKHLKIMPLPVFFCMSCLIVVGIYVLFGSAITLLVSLLQRGF